MRFFFLVKILMIFFSRIKCFCFGNFCDNRLFKSTTRIKGCF
ncbi:peptide methionine S-sulfoxide reductase [Listeria monocytogenes]|nr:peptide methionine S-sulfoxide reductase [Listeria monocytogenes]GAT40779.1 peptide methionine S-sulfoxide reductase [Listeria monocytogenes]